MFVRSKTDNESTRSIFETLSFNYMNEVISLTSEKTELAVADLPAMPFSNRSDVLADDALPVSHSRYEHFLISYSFFNQKLDPLLNKRRSIFWGLLSAFRESRRGFMLILQ